MEEDELPTCSICLTCFGTNEPNRAYLLLCGHSYHLHCIKESSSKSKSNEIICPLCRSPTPGSVSSLKLNFSLTDLLEIFEKDKQEQDKTTPCGECGYEASWFCVYCDVSFCGVHDKIIHSMKVMASHNRVPISEKNLHVVKKCIDHNEPLKIFCITCQSSICNLCRDYGLHKTHQTDLVTSIVKQAQSKLQDSLQNVEKTVHGLDKTLVMLTESVEKVRKIGDGIDNKIDQQVNELIMCLHARASFLKEESKKIVKEEEDLLNQQRENVAAASALGHALCDEIRHVQNKGEELLIESNNQITEKIQSAQSVWLLLDMKDSTNLEIPYSLDCKNVEAAIQQFGIVGHSNRKKKEDTKKMIKREHKSKKRKFEGREVSKKRKYEGREKIKKKKIKLSAEDNKTKFVKKMHH